MADKILLGVFWAKDSLIFIETFNNQPSKIFNIPFPASLETNQQNQQKEQEAASNPLLITAIQDSIQQEKISTKEINLSLPARDIIFRSFLIPWMPPNEVKGVVAFEAAKYIPFPLNELSYCYHCITITEGNNKQLRVIFAAIKKDVLKAYTEPLENAGLTINIIEPAPQSLIRSLILNNLIPLEETIALIEKGGKTGRIIIMDHGVPEFVREFQLKPPAAEQEAMDPKSLMLRLVNEVRISLDYFNRQHPQQNVTQISILSTVNVDKLAESLSSELSMPIKPILTQAIIKDVPIEHPGYLNAFGIGLIYSVDTPADLNFSDKKISKVKRKKSSPGILDKSSNKYKDLVITVLLCIGIAFACQFVFGQASIKFKKQVKNLEKQLGIDKDASVKTIKKNNDGLKTKIETYESIHLETQAAAFLLKFPAMMPQGTWFEKLEIKHKKPQKGKKTIVSKKATVTLTGYAYSEDKKAQFSLVDQLSTTINGNEFISDYFEEIMPQTSVSSKRIKTFNVTQFIIKLEKE